MQILETFKDLSSTNRVSAKTGFWLGRLVITCLGIVIVSMLFLLPGCGSGSGTKSAEKAQKEKKVKSDAAAKALTPLFSDNFKEVGTAPPLQPGDKHPLNLTPEEVDAKRKDVAEREEKYSPKREFLPGLNLEKLESERAKKPNVPPEVLPGLTLGQLEAKRAEAEKRASMPREILPGLTAEQARAGAEQTSQRQKAESGNPEQLFPSQPERKVVK